MMWLARKKPLGLSVGVLAMAVSMSLASFGAAAASDEVRNAADLLKSGNAKAAYELLLPLSQARSGDPDFDFVFGVSAIDGGHPSTGVFALERVLSVQPDNLQARAEIARGYLMLGELETSRAEFETVKAASPPPEVAATIDKFLGTLDLAVASQGTTFNKYVELSVGEDSNVNGASSVANIAIPVFGGAVFTQTGTSLAQRDSFWGLAGGANFRHAYSPGLFLSGGLNVNGRQNGSLSAFDTTGIDGNIGLTWGADAHQVSATVQGGSNSVNNAIYREVWGATGQWAYNPGTSSQYSTYLQYSALTYPNAGFKNADRVVLGGAYARALSTTYAPVIFTGMYFGSELPKTAGQGNLGYELVGLRLGGQLAFSPAITLFTNLSYENRGYGGRDPLFLVVRKDDQTDLRVGANVKLSGGWVLTPQLAYTENSSNIVIYKNDKTQVSVALRLDF